MTGLLESLSVCLYAAGALLMAAAAAVYKKNGLYEYHCLMQGRAVREKSPAGGAVRPARKDIGKAAYRKRGTQAGKSSPPVVYRDPAREMPETRTQVLDGSSDTALLEKESGITPVKAQQVPGSRAWGRPSARFRVTKSEVVVHTDKAISRPAGKKGERDEA